MNATVFVRTVLLSLLLWTFGIASAQADLILSSATYMLRTNLGTLQGSFNPLTPGDPVVHTAVDGPRVATAAFHRLSNSQLEIEASHVFTGGGLADALIVVGFQVNEATLALFRFDTEGMGTNGEPSGRVTVPPFGNPQWTSSQSAFIELLPGQNYAVALQSGLGGSVQSPMPGFARLFIDTKPIVIPEPHSIGVLALASGWFRNRRKRC